MLKSITMAIGIAYIWCSSTAWAGYYTESNIHDYMAPLEAAHKTDAEKKGLEIYKQQYLLDQGWGDMEAKMNMLLIDASGRESHRKVVKRSLEDRSQPDRTQGVFLEPADVRGTIMLTFEQPYDADEQWLYLPSLKRTKKINAENKSGSFLGTEFSWEDISTKELTKFHYKLVGDEGKTWMVERTPVYKFSGYSREVTWVNKDNNQTVKIDYYDKKGDLLKTQICDNWEQYKGRYWRPLRLEMTNYQNQRKTILSMSSYTVGAGLDKKVFSSLGLSRIDLQKIK